MVRGRDEFVSELASYSNYQSSNAAEVYHVNMVVYHVNMVVYHANIGGKEQKCG